MKVREIMTKQVIPIAPTESVEVAARTLAQYNIGSLPVCGSDGTLCGVVTDRDLVTRCVAAGKIPGKTRVREVMSSAVTCAQPDMEVGVAAHLMGRQQVRRLPVTENGRLCGMVSLADMAAREDSAMDAADVLAEVSVNISKSSNEALLYAKFILIILYPSYTSTLPVNLFLKIYARL